MMMQALQHKQVLKIDISTLFIPQMAMTLDLSSFCTLYMNITAMLMGNKDAPVLHLYDKLRTTTPNNPQS